MVKYYKIEPFKELWIRDRNDLKTLFMRCLCGTISQTIYVFGMKLLPISFASMIFNISPFFVTVLAFFLLIERISPLDIIGLLGSFAGVLFLIYGE